MPSKVAKILENLSYGPALEARDVADAWLDDHHREFGCFINGGWKFNGVSTSSTTSSSNEVPLKIGNCGSYTPNTVATAGDLIDNKITPRTPRYEPRKDDNLKIVRDNINKSGFKLSVDNKALNNNADNNATTSPESTSDTLSVLNTTVLNTTVLNATTSVVNATVVTAETAGNTGISNKSGFMDSVSPKDQKFLAKITDATPQLVDQAVESAKHAYDNVWSKLTPFERSKHMYNVARNIQKHSRLLAVLESLDSGKTIRESRDADIPLVIRHWYYHAGWAQDQHSITGDSYEPLGVVAGILPWNFPLMLLSWKVCPALAMGNTIVIKPAPNTSLTALCLAEICIEAGLPKGVFNVVTGGGIVGQILAEHKLIKKVAFTGSTFVGKHLRRITAGSGKKLSLELGGKSPFIIFEDADIDSAIEGIIDSIFFNQGHVCCAGSRILIQETIKDKIIYKLKKRIEKLRIGDSLDKSIDISSINNKIQYKKILQYIEIAKQEGSIIFQGKQIQNNDSTTNDINIIQENNSTTNDINIIQENNSTTNDINIIQENNSTTNDINIIQENNYNIQENNYNNSNIQSDENFTSLDENDNWYIPPTIILNAQPAHTCSQEEIFGPVASILTFRTLKEALNIANQTRYGLASSVWTESNTVAYECSLNLKCGFVWINSHNIFDATCEFGGIRQSGYGRDGGKEGLYEYLKYKMPLITSTKNEIEILSNRDPYADAELLKSFGNYTYDRPKITFNNDKIKKDHDEKKSHIEDTSWITNSWMQNISNTTTTITTSGNVNIGGNNVNIGIISGGSKNSINNSTDNGEDSVLIDHTLKLYINGKQKRPDGGYTKTIYRNFRTNEKLNPKGFNPKDFNPKDLIIGRVAEGSRKDIRDAVAAAKVAQVGWAKCTPFNRSQILYYLAENLELRKIEFAKTLRAMMHDDYHDFYDYSTTTNHDYSTTTHDDSTNNHNDSTTTSNLAPYLKEVNESVERLFYYAGKCDKMGGEVKDSSNSVVCSINEPIGTIGIICPNESPLLSFISLLAPAISRGNTVIIIPSEKFPLAAIDFYQILECSDVPNGVINIITGNRDLLTKSLVEHQNLDAIWFFGPERRGSRFVELVSAENLKRTLCNYGQQYNWNSSTTKKIPMASELLRQSVAVKTIWNPVGDSFAN